MRFLFLMFITSSLQAQKFAIIENKGDYAKHFDYSDHNSFVGVLMNNLSTIPDMVAENGLAGVYTEPMLTDYLKLEQKSRFFLIDQMHHHQKDLLSFDQLKSEIKQQKNPSLDYTSIEIDGTFWMAENLNVKTFRNGDSIPQATDTESWERAASNRTPAWCYYEFNPSNETNYGILYNHYVIQDERGIGKEGWSIPTQGDIWVLLYKIGVKDPREEVAHNPVGKKLINKTSFKNYPGTNSIGFNMITTGYAHSARTKEGNIFEKKMDFSGFWDAHGGLLTVNPSGLTYPNYFWGDGIEGFGFPIRLVKPNE
jgi:uncharacterized protein (TIGR02145 family)